MTNCRPWPLMLDPDGVVAEGTGHNVFIVKRGIVSALNGNTIGTGRVGPQFTTLLTRWSAPDAPTPYQFAPSVHRS